MIYKILLFIILLISGYEDYKKREVSNIYVVLLFILGIIKGFNITINSIATILFLLLIKKIFDKCIGFGDIKIMIGLTLIYSEWYVIIAFMFSSIISYTYMKLKNKERIPLLPIFNSCYVLTMLIDLI